MIIKPHQMGYVLYMTGTPVQTTLAANSLMEPTF